MNLRFKGHLLAAVAAAVAISGPARAADKVVELKKVFPYLEAYQSLPAAERSRFAPTYVFRQEGRPLAAPMWILEGATRTPLTLAEGRPERLPTAAQLASGKLQVGVDEKTKISISLGMVPTLAPAAEMDARELSAAVAQAAAGVRQIAGPMGFMVPKVKSVAFYGVSSGEARFADGRRTPLPVEKGTPVFDPARMSGAVAVRFPQAPSRLEFN